DQDDSISFEKWCIPTGYSLDSDNSSLAEQVPKSSVLSSIELLLDIESDMRIDLDRDLELLFFISVLKGVDSGYKVSLPICLKFSNEVDETSVDIGNILVEIVLSEQAQG
ncbi:9447_t:CDS:2, partial [Gigaspora margarita]